MAVGKVVIAERIVSAALEVATAVPLVFIALRRAAVAALIEAVVVHPASFHGRGLIGQLD